MDEATRQAGTRRAIESLRTILEQWGHELDDDERATIEKAIAYFREQLRRDGAT